MSATRPIGLPLSAKQVEGVGEAFFVMRFGCFDDVADFPEALRCFLFAGVNGAVNCADILPTLNRRLFKPLIRTADRNDRDQAGSH